MRKLPKLPLQYFLLIAFLVPLSALAQTITVSNPSQCGIGLNLPDGGCDPAIVIPQPTLIGINVANAPGTVLGLDVILSEVHLIVRHTWANDLDIYLRSPSGIEIALTLDNGDSDDNYGDPDVPGCGVPAVFTMASCVSIAHGQAPFTDQPYRPQGSFSAFNDGVTNPNGQWILSICDDAFDDVGSLEYLNLVFAPIACLPVEDAVVVGVDTTAVTLSWLPANSCGTFLIEYGAPGFQPGSGAAPGPQGTVVSLTGCPPFTLTGFAPETQYEFYVRQNCQGSISGNSCPRTFTTGCLPPPPSLRTHFDSQANCGILCNSLCNFTGEVWYNAQDDGFDWLVDGGGTLTFGTGPADDVSGGGKYVYLEASSDLCLPNKTAYLLSNCIELDKQGSDTCHLSFYYHMFGDGIGTLRLQVSDNGGQSWATLWQRQGNQGDAWQKVYIGLGQYPDGAVLQFRFAGTEGPNSRGDMALDEIIFYGSRDLGRPVFEYFADNDGDGFGNPNQRLRSCSPTPPPGYVLIGGDCNDNNPNINPGAVEIPCNGIDENCSGADATVLPPPQFTTDTICSGSTAILAAVPAFDRFIFWYGSPDGDDLLGFGETFIPPQPLLNNSPGPAFYTFYATETDFICGSEPRAAVTVVVHPLPNVSTSDTPEICQGESFDLSSITIQDLNFTGGTATFHTALPATAANRLDNTIVSPGQTTAYFFRVVSPEGCAGTGSVTVSVRPRPSLAFAPAQSFSLCRETSTAISVQPSGGDGPYNYFWSTGAMSSSINVTANFTVGATDKYFLTVTDSRGCAAQDSVLVTTTVSIDSLRRFVTDVSTCSGSDGSILLVPLDGISPFSYEWRGSNGLMGSAAGIADTLLIDSLPQGSYRITVTDSSPQGCSIVLRSVIVNGPSAVVQGIDIQEVSCAGAADGQICLSFFGGSPQLQWSDGSTGSCASDLEGGSYAVTLTEGMCQSILEDLVVEEPAPLGLAASLLPPSCAAASDGRIDIVPFGGTPPYTYQWSNNTTSRNLMNASSGTYTLTLTDAKACVYVDSFALNAPSALVIELEEQRNISCFGLSDGLLQAVALGGTPPYQYAWSTGSAAPLLANLSPGSYTLSVQDFNGCQQQAVYSLSTPSPVMLALDSIYQPECVGNKNGRISVVASGGTAPYQYSWSEPGMDSVLSNLPVGTYFAYASDANNCPPDTLEVVLSAVSVLELTALTVPPTCVGLHNGSVSLVPGPSAEPPFIYQWARGDTTAAIAGVGVGDYFVRIIDGQECEFDTIIQVEAPQVFEVSLQVAQPSCHGGDDGLIVPNLIRAGAPPIRFDWCNGSTQPQLVGLSDGQYCLTISDNIGCAYVIEEILIESPPPFELGVAAIGSILCHGDSTGFIELNVRGGSPPYNFDWIGQDVAEQNIYNLPAGTYQLLAQDANSCPLDSTFTLAQPPPIQVNIQTQAQSSCSGGMITQLSGQISGGMPPYLFLWSSGDTAITIPNPAPNDYILSVTDANRCQAESPSVKVQAFTPPFQIESFQVSNVSCHGAADGCVIVKISGGSNRYTYHFSDGFIVADTNADSIGRCGLSPGNYKVTVTDLNTGCTAMSVTVPLTQPPALFFKRDSIKAVTCFGGEDGAIYTTTTGGLAPYFYTWFNSAFDLVGNTPDVTGLPGGQYTGYLTDSNGCTATVTGTVPTSSTRMRDTLAVVQPVRCQGGSSGAISLVIIGGTPPYSYAWSHGAQSRDVNNLPAGLYSLTVTDQLGCQVVFSDYEVREPAEALSLAVEAISASCHALADGSASASVSGGNAPYNFEWFYQGQIIAVAANTSQLDGLAAGPYSLTLRDSNNCVLQTNFAIGEPDELMVGIELSPPVPPEPGTAEAIVSGGTPGYDYLWNTGETSPTIAVQPGAYALTVTDQNGCPAEASLQVVQTFELSLVERARLYPNPASERLWLELQLAEAVELQWSIFSALGQPWQQGLLPSSTQQRLEIELGALPPGVYWLVLYARGQAVYRGRFIKG
jgi:hypothetical protein